MRTEFEFIQNIKKKYGLSRIGDDCAVLPKDKKTDMVVTADMMVEDIDFRLDWTTPKFLGHKALAVSLSDVAAMGAEPKWAMLTLAIPVGLWKTDFVDELFDGFCGLAQKFDVEVVGGDLSKTADKMVLDSIVAGVVPKGKAILRSGAVPGDSIFVTGELGGAAAGLSLLESGTRYGNPNQIWQNKLVRKQLEPYPQINEGNLLQTLGVSSMIDLSDGLSSDLSHICSKSGVGAIVYAEKIPIDRKIKGLRMPLNSQLDIAINGGEDFELLFTANNKKISLDNFTRFYCVGEITANIGIIELIRDGEAEILEAKGYRHF